MIRHRFYPEGPLHVLRLDGAETLLSLVEFGAGLAKSTGPERDLNLPALIDMRRVNLAADTTLSVKKAIRQRKSLTPEGGGGLCAYVMGESGSFGMMRMYSIYAELEGLRDEALTLVTLDYDEAVAWLLKQMDPGPEAARAIRAALEAQGAGVRPPS